jgi:hypothetical protein
MALNDRMALQHLVGPWPLFDFPNPSILYKVTGFLNLHNSSICDMALELTASKRTLPGILFLGVKCIRRTSVSRLSRECGCLDVSQPFRPPGPLLTLYGLLLILYGTLRLYSFVCDMEGWSCRNVKGNEGLCFSFAFA